MESNYRAEPSEGHDCFEAESSGTGKRLQLGARWSYGIDSWKSTWWGALELGGVGIPRVWQSRCIPSIIFALIAASPCAPGVFSS